MHTTKEGVPVVDARVPGFIEHLEHALSNQGRVCDRDRPYEGQPWTTQGERGKILVAGLTKRDIFDCLLMAMVDVAAFPQRTPGEFDDHFDFTGRCKVPGCEDPRCKLEAGTLTVDDVYHLDLSSFDPVALAQNLDCRIEKRMGIFPAIPASAPTTEQIIQGMMQDETG